jgi:DNA-binding response OmpR family regulator
MAGDDDRVVVVADDDEAMRLLCRVNLELDGFRVREAGSAAELMEAVAAADVALVLLDIHFGKDDGIEVARRMRSERPEIAIAFLSGSVHFGERAAQVSDGAIRKPFRLEELMETVRTLARR